MKLADIRSVLAISGLACALSMSVAVARAEITGHEPSPRKICSSLRYRHSEEGAQRRVACRGLHHARLHFHPHREIRRIVYVSPPPRIVYADLLNGGVELGVPSPKPSDAHLDARACEGSNVSLLCPGVIMYGTAY